VTNSSEHDEFTVFFEKEYRPIVALVMRAGANFEDAEDAVSEAMTLASGRFSHLENPGAWVRKVAVRRFVRKHHRDRERELREQFAASSVAQARIDDGDHQRLVRDLINDLPSAQRKVMALHLDGYTTAEIAAFMDSPQDTVRSNLRHARRALSAGLKKAGWPTNR
jgi:RNA polymerase sigma factor (sigma-70 family)